MPYLIDGHNLIPKIPGLNLQAMDDEIHLIELLQEFCRIQRRQVEVYFDNAPPGQAGLRRYGQVAAYFVRQGSTADVAIRQRLASLGNGAVNWTVVTSDLAVQAAAQARRAQVLSSESFAQLLQRALVQTSTKGERPPAEPSPDEVAEWLKIFGQDSEQGTKKS